MNLPPFFHWLCHGNINSQHLCQSWPRFSLFLSSLASCNFFFKRPHMQNIQGLVHLMFWLNRTRKFIYSVTTSLVCSTLQMPSPYSEHSRSFPTLMCSFWSQFLLILLINESQNSLCSGIQEIISIDTQKSLYSPGIISLLFVSSPWDKSSLTVKDFISLTTTPTFEFSTATSTMVYIFHCFIFWLLLRNWIDVYSLSSNSSLLVHFLYPWSNCYHGMGICLILFTYLYTFDVEELGSFLRKSKN